MKITLSISAKGFDENQTILFPVSWKQVPEQCYHEITPYLLGAQNDNLYAKVKIIEAIIKASIRDVEFKKVNIQLPPEVALSLLPKLDWMLEKPNAVQPFMFFNHKGVKYYSPSDTLGNTVMSEFDNCDYAFRKYLKTRKQHWLARLVAILCREERIARTTDEKLQKRYDKRQRFRAAFAVERSERFKDLEPWIYHSVLNYYIASLLVLNERYDLFEKKIEGAEAELPQPAFVKSDKANDWEAIMMDLADGDPNKLKAFQSQSTHEFLKMIKRLNERYKKMEAKLTNK